ncbi:MAG TPA: hypothetical protein PK400_10490 [Phycisphaerales bacterium]|nr:hypothetical protein [Phycisphaerales bacterium]HRQ76927.1 hypothetical protein [Phycisphaerales bacterium]
MRAATLATCFHMRFLLILNLVCLAALAAGCAARSLVPADGARDMKIEVLGFDDCPNTGDFHERVLAAAKQLDLHDSVAYVDQEQLPANDLRRGYPAPSALVNGRDLFDLPEPETPSLGCRMYPGGLPSVDDIARRLRAISGKE